MYQRIFAALGLVGVAACGGSSSGGATSPTVDPVAASGFASASTAVTGGSSFDVQNARRLLGDDQGNIVIDRQDIEYRIAPDAQTVTVVVAGETYVLNATFAGYEYSAPGEIVQAFRIYAPTDDAEIVDVFAVIDGELNDGDFVIGFDTDPAQVAARSGTASLDGRIFVTARNGFDRAFADGDLTLDVNFDANTISGDATVVDTNDLNSSFSIPTTTFSLEETDIVGNGFSGDIVATSNNLGGTLSNSGYDGRFYGAGAPTAGGQIAGQITNEDDSSDVIFFEGAFLATE